MNRREADEVRAAFLAELRTRLIGPTSEAEELRERPNKRYLAGMLFPRGAAAGSATADEEELAEDEADDQEQQAVDSPTDMLFQRLPASVGVTFALHDEETSLAVEVSAARYERQQAQVLAAEDRGRSPQVWRRIPLAPAGVPERIKLPAHDGHASREVLGGRAAVHLYIRRSRGARIATVSIVNTAQAEQDAPVRVEDVLFQVQLECLPACGVQTYPDAELLAADPEGAELALLYRSAPVYAVGHGCASAWTRTDAGAVSSVRAEFMPSAEVPPVTTDISTLTGPAREVLSLVRLQDPAFDPAPGLAAFVNEYATWRNRIAAERLPARYDAAKATVLGRIDAAIKRMRSGIRLLSEASAALDVFRLANRAMLLNIVRTAANRDRDPGARYSDVVLDALDANAWVWRPFQLAFFLLSLDGLWNPSHPDRSVVDLIWFPTGGGKTEAYLGVAAFEMIRRRTMMGPDGDGTAVIKRYTLRLLTIQQFERAGGLICALETLRHRGDIPGSRFTLGLWVGQDSSPNSHADAVQDLNKILGSVGRVEGVRVPLKHCPACAKALVPVHKQEGSEGVGLRNASGRVELFCPREECEYHEGLPISFVDDDLYDDPPTMLLGTVDKFAMLAWRDEARAFFGTGLACAPPSLIVQDELHLISGPLGTLAGVYEAAIDTAIGALGPAPKYICATATIRRADDQIRKLYGRDAALFPPPGIDAADSYFSKSESARPGRLYVGAMGQGHTPTFSNVIASTALLAAAGELRERIGDVVDPWWTLVSYHNSKRELGKTLSLARDDVPARLRSLGERRRLNGAGVRELSANLRDSEIPEVLHHLSVGLPQPQALDFVACTNMLSVGVDVQRLGLMMVNGQPKTVAEYIQASSRVGRDPRRLPGIVLALFSPTKPRDRSHYEFFSSFHNGYYRHVEPTSVTPGALPALERGLHGAFLALVRMTSRVHANNHASWINSHVDEIQDIADRFLTRLAAARDGELAEASDRLAMFIDYWRRMATERGANLRFQSSGQAHAALIRPYRQPGQGWETLQSLRHVDTPLRLTVPVVRAGAEA